MSRHFPSARKVAWRTLRAFLATGALLGCVTVPRQVEDGIYCAREPLVGDTGVTTFPLGDFQMKLEVIHRYGRRLVSFWNSMPDSQHVLAIDAVEVSRDSSGSLSFAFADGWGNKGQGRLTPAGVVTLEIVERSPEPSWGNIERNYGTFLLRRGTCNF